MMPRALIKLHALPLKITLAKIVRGISKLKLLCIKVKSFRWWALPPLPPHKPLSWTSRTTAQSSHSSLTCFTLQELRERATSREPSPETQLTIPLPTMPKVNWAVLRWLVTSLVSRTPSMSRFLSWQFLYAWGNGFTWRSLTQDRRPVPSYAASTFSLLPNESASAEGSDTGFPTVAQKEARSGRVQETQTSLALQETLQFRTKT